MSNIRATGRGLFLLAVTATVLLCGQAGCGRKVWLNVYPDFYDPKLQNVAVAPFHSPPNQPDVGIRFAEALAAELVRNGTYRVTTPDALRASLGQADWQALRTAEAPAAADLLRKLPDVQAALRGTVESSAATVSAWRDRYRYGPGYWYYDRPSYYWGRYRPYCHRCMDWQPTLRHEATVSATAEMVRVPDGETIHRTPVPVTATVYSEGWPPDLSPSGVLAEATGRAVRQLVEQFAVTRRQVRVDAGKALRTAAGPRDGEWKFADRFSPADEEMFVVLRLPPQAARNYFRLTIDRKDGPRDLAMQELVWDAAADTRAFRFSPRELAAKGGHGKYVARLGTTTEEVAERTFRIEPED